MRKEYKEILFKDLSTRLPYGVECEIRQRENASPVLHDKLTCGTIKCMQENDWCIKPFLRSMSKMTEEEKKDWRAKVLMSPKVVFSDKIPDLYEFCNAHHLDYRKVYDEEERKWKSMIEMGLALEAPERMYSF